ncbi:MAG: disulfide bond formation protein B [Pseudohongiellaceae bacterium]
MNLFSTRLINLYIFLFCTAAMAIALYMQHAMGMEPCHLCITQRVFYIAVGFTALAAFIHNPAAGGKLVYGSLVGLFALAGGGFALRQIYLQHLPADQVPACGPSLGYMMEEFPIMEVLSVMLSGDGNCAEISWQDPLIGMSIPEWSLVAFIGLAAAGVYQAIRK